MFWYFCALNTTLYCVSAPSVNQVFNVDFEINPLHVEADMSLRLTVQPVEIVYDEVNLQQVYFLRLNLILTKNTEKTVEITILTSYVKGLR